MNKQPNDTLRSSNETQIEKDNASHPAPTRRREDQNVDTRSDLPADAVQPGVNEATDDPN